MKRLLLSVIILISMMGGAAYSVQQGLYVPGNLTVTGTTGAIGKIFSPAGMNAVGGTVEADHFIGDGSAISNLSINYAILSGTASQAADIILSGQATGDLMYFNGSNWTRLAAGPAENNLRSSGPGLAPTWSMRPWKVIGNTIEAITGTNNLAFNSDAFILLDNARTRYLTWNSGNNRFEFNGDLYSGGILGGSFVGVGTSLSSLDASQLTLGVVSPQRGGLGNDISGASWGSILYHDNTTWRVLAPGTSGNHFMTMGAGADPMWGASPSGTVTQIFTTGSLTGGAITTIGTLDVANGGITAAKLQTGSVTSGAIADGSIAEVDLGSRVVTSGAIALNTITAANLANGSVTSGAIAIGGITAVNMGTGSVTKGAIAAADGGTNVYLKWDGSDMLWATPMGGSGSIEVDNLTTAINVNGSIEVKAGGIVASRLATGAVTSVAIADNTITGADINTTTVITAAAFDGTILGVITAANMGANSVTQAAIAAGSPGTNNFLRWNGSAMEWASPGTVTGSLEVDNLSIHHNIYGSLEVINLGITASKIANNTITPAKMGTNSVTADALANDAVDTNAIVDQNVTGGKIANTTIDGTKLAAGINISTTGYMTAETVKATTFYGGGENLSGISANYAILSGTSSKAADLNITGQTQGAIIYFNGTSWVTLEPGTAGNTLRSGGTGANPLWATGAWRSVGTTIETYVSGNDLKLNSGAKLILDNSHSKFLTWNQSDSRFEFNGNVSINGTISADASALFNLNASNISSGILGLARGGLGSDTSGAGWGQILYKNNVGNWVALAPSATPGYHLASQGTGANPTWVQGGTLISVGAGRGLTTTTNPITTTGVITIDTNVVVTTADAQTLTNKTINSGLIDGNTSINTTGVATFGAAGMGLDVANIGLFGARVSIGSREFDSVNPETLKVDAGTSTSKNVISGIGNLNNYLQLNIHNRNAGGDASSDLVATADNGDETNNYVDIGINSSGFNNPSYAGGPNTVYFMGKGADMYVENAQPGKSLIFMTGGAAPGDERMLINGSGLVSIATTEPTATLEVAGNVKIGIGAASPGTNGLSVAGNSKVGGNLGVTGLTTLEGSAYIKAGKNLSLGDTTSGSSNLLVPFLFSGTVNAGDVVVLDTAAANTVKTTTTAKDSNVVGFAQRIEGTTAYVAVSGRITSAVANQAISIGDAICTSATAGRVNGYGTLQTGKMIGMAVTSAAGSGNSISVLICKY